MNKRPFFAAMLFGGLSFAGIVAMFSQSEPLDGTVNTSHAVGTRQVSLNPGGGSHEPQYSEVLPRVIEDGVEHQIERMSSDKEKSPDAKPRRNILRLR